MSNPDPTRFTRIGISGRPDNRVNNITTNRSDTFIQIITAPINGPVSTSTGNGTGIFVPAETYVLGSTLNVIVSDDGGATIDVGVSGDGDAFLDGAAISATGFVGTGGTLQAPIAGGEITFDVITAAIDELEAEIQIVLLGKE